ncbi:ubiquinol oxidase subunit II [Bowmanella dokdonensis]|uniref:Ubiquinol oxidase subunit 2 n=1 Tax=Bowmanella dokdonensis TaxID=751969 RepID=A0A939DPB4_9ALTE|nr:ubiquinol oxidase subunit II [Bowmanella dokdonensis]MBN7826193.1 ubiquinol oxidase subunit II [Bowmanella dokdonensis]
MNRNGLLFFSLAGIICPASAQIPILNPNGPVAEGQYELLISAVLIMLIVVVPVFILTICFAWRYRASNRASRFRPDWSYSLPIELVIWLVPALIVLVIGFLQWTRTHSLDPYKALGRNPLEIQVIALDWKWLFIYPDADIATVNELVLPVDVPVRFLITSDTVMNAFFIPGLGSQIFAMAGMRTELNLKATKPASLWGRNTQFSGRGFSSQHFNVKVVEESEFQDWQGSVQEGSPPLTNVRYRQLALPSSGSTRHQYHQVQPGLFGQVISRYQQEVVVPQSREGQP